MVIEQTQETTDRDSLEKPFTKVELFKFLFVCLFIPWIAYGPMLILGAYLRTYPSFPPLWRGFWFVEITLTVGYMICFLFLRNHPRIIRIRIQKIKPDQSDSIHEQDLARYATAVGLPGFLSIPYDAVSRADTFPILLNAAGSFCILLSLVWITIVFRQNKFASRVVFKQEGHQLITNGLYGFVRHPMYLGVIPLFLGFPLCVGSYYGLIPMAFFIILAAYRTFSEEELLVATFGDEYLKYREEVKYRIIPYIF